MMGTTKERIVLRLTGAIGALVVAGAVAAAAQQDTASWQEVEKALGVAGSVQPGDVYKVSLPRTDLDVTVDGVPVRPAFALGSCEGGRSRAVQNVGKWPGRLSSTDRNFSTSERTGADGSHRDRRDLEEAG